MYPLELHMEASNDFRLIRNSLEASVDIIIPNDLAHSPESEPIDLLLDEGIFLSHILVNDSLADHIRIIFENPFYCFRFPSH